MPFVINLTNEEGTPPSAVVQFAWIEPTKETLALLPEDHPVRTFSAVVGIEKEVAELTDDTEKLMGLLRLRIEAVLAEMGKTIYNQQVQDEAKEEAHEEDASDSE